MNTEKIAAKLRELADLFEESNLTSQPATSGWGAPRPVAAEPGPTEPKPWDVPCPQCSGALRIVPAGISKRTGRPYREFIGCSTCDYKADLAPERGVA